MRHNRVNTTPGYTPEAVSCFKWEEKAVSVKPFNLKLPPFISKNRPPVWNGFLTAFSLIIFEK
jgi:hypothetical protein